VKLDGVVIATVGLVAPTAYGFDGGIGEEGISAESPDGEDGSVFGYVDFEHDISGAMSGASLGGVVGLDAADEAVLSFIGIQPDGFWRRLSWG
jgi:hypothetical protein